LPYSPAVQTAESLLKAAREGDESSFRGLVEPYRRELLAQCYRMLGSLHDAEDLVQETMVRAWRGIAKFEGRSSVRTWLHTIATHATLDALDQRKVRTLPTALSGPSNPKEVAPPVVDDPIWLEPFPDHELAGIEAGPDAILSAQESVALAFLQALQQLPAKQRVVLLSRDVLGFSAAEVAGMIEATVPAVNSLLQRAREITGVPRPEAAAAAGEKEKDLLERYLQAWESSDVSKLVALLREDARLSMPPMPGWYLGPDAIAASIGGMVLTPGSAGRLMLEPTHANGLPAFGVYQMNESGVFQGVGVQLVRTEDGKIAEITAFLDPTLVKSFGLAATL
jgi:RNA polymerase sigma-70 factor (ECF subfamily)